MLLNRMQMILYGLFIAFLLLAHSVGCTDPRIDVGSRNQFHIGGLFPVHGKGNNEREPCGIILRDKGIQRLEAMLYALDHINTDRSFWKISLGATIFDTCSWDSYALEQTLGFLKMSECIGDGWATRRVTAVVGAANSPVSESVANILRLFKVPQVSYASTSEELDNTHKFPFFYRVVPSDRFQVQAILDLVRVMRWTYLSAVASRGEYGERAVEQLQDIMRNSTFEDICFATVELLPRSPLEKDYDSLIEKLLNHEKARAVIVFLNEDKLRQMLVAADRRNVRGHFLWIGSDSWGAKFQPVQNIERAAEGAITILPKRFPIPGFDEYFLSLKPDTNRRNPWFKEFWESQFNCVFDKNNTSARLTGGRIVKKSCTGEEDLQPSFRQEGLVAMVVDSVYVIAHALRNLCIDNPKMCKDWDKKPDGKLLREYVANVTFNSSQAHAMTIKFDSERSIPINYTIYQFRKIDEPGREYDYIPIGEWNLERRLVLWEEPRWRKESQTNDYDSFRIESSACSVPCEPGEERVRMHHRRCCWTCRPCDGDYYLPHQYAHCTPCPTGYVPNDDRMSCKWLRAEYMGSDWGSPWALVPSLFSCLGILCTMIAIAVFILYRKTPVIKASGRELCYVIFAGVLLCYCFTFIVVTEPTKARCGMLRVGLGLGLSVCYSAIFTKTNRISRIFNRRLSTTKRPAYISPRSQIVIVLCLVSIQLTLSVMWLIVSPPTVKTYTLESPRAYLVTCGIDNTSVLLGLLYNMLLVILCTVYAYKTRNIPENFNEAKFISFTMYSSCIVWLAFVAIYSSTWKDFKVQSTILCMSVSMSGTVVLLCLFFPKLYLVLLKPHKNVRYPNSTTHSASAMDTMMPVRYVRSGVSPSSTLSPPQPCATSSCNSYNLSTSPDLKISNSSTE